MILLLENYLICLTIPSATKASPSVLKVEHPMHVTLLSPEFCDLFSVTGRQDNK